MLRLLTTFLSFIQGPLLEKRINLHQFNKNRIKFFTWAITQTVGEINNE